MSGRGGTMGRAAGCPARFGLAGGRKGLPPPTGAAGPGATVAPGAMGLAGVNPAGAGPVSDGPGRSVGILGTAVAAASGMGGRGAPGAGGGAFGNSPTSAGSGCRGPESIWPGRGPGTGLAAMADPRITVGASGAACPVESGGLKGFAGRGGSTRSS